jgi:hypothetical protein
MALARLDASAHFEFDSGEMQVTRTNLKLFLDERINVTGDQFLQNQIDSLAARRAAYEAHRRPKASAAAR